MLPRHEIRILSQLSTHLSKYKDQRLVLFNAGPSEGVRGGGGGCGGATAPPFCFQLLQDLRDFRGWRRTCTKKPRNPLLTGLVQCDFRRTTSSSALVSALGWDSLHTRRLLAQWSAMGQALFVINGLPHQSFVYLECSGATGDKG